MAFSINTRTRRMLACGIVAGPVYLLIGLVQALTRPGFDLTRHDLSLLSNGDLGWIQIANFVVSGLLVIAGARGMSRTSTSSWGPRLIGAYGLGLIGAGIFVADPALGFPPGAVAAQGISWHGLLHIVSGGLGFLALIAACFVLARRFRQCNQRGWALYSSGTGVIFFASFLGIASGSPNGWIILGFWVGIVLAWGWLAAVSGHLLLGGNVESGLSAPRGELEAEAFAA